MTLRALIAADLRVAWLWTQFRLLRCWPLSQVAKAEWRGLDFIHADVLAELTARYNAAELAIWLEWGATFGEVSPNLVSPAQAARLAKEDFRAGLLHGRLSLAHRLRAAAITSAPMAALGRWSHRVASAFIFGEGAATPRFGALSVLCRWLRGRCNRLIQRGRRP